MWYIDLGASFHMTGNKGPFSSLEEKDTEFHIEHGDDGRYVTKGVGTVSPRREFSSLIHLKNVICVLILKKNFVLVSIEDKGYDFVFRKGMTYLKHSAIGHVKKIEVRINNLYKLEVDACVTLRNKEEGSQTRDVVVEQEKDRALKMEPQIVS